MTGFQGRQGRLQGLYARLRGGLLLALCWACCAAQAGILTPAHGGATAAARPPEPKQLLKQIRTSGAKAVLDTLRVEQRPLMLKGIESGETAWLDVAVALDGTADADLAGSLTLAVGVALARAPRKVLSILGGAMPVDEVCGFPDLADPRTNTEQKVIHYLDQRIAAVAALHGKLDLQVRADCLAVLARRRRDVIGPDGPFSH